LLVPFEDHAVINWNPTTHYKDVAVAERYDRERFSSVPGRVFNALERRCVRKAFADLPRSARLLDVPCGTGRFAEVLLDEGFFVTGVDISQPMLEVAKRKLQRHGPRFRPNVADVHDLAKAEVKSYDAALCARVLMHFPLEEQITFLHSVADLAKIRVVFSQSLDTPYQRLRRRIKRFLGNQPPAAYPISEDDLAKLLASAGLREVARMRPMALLSEAIYVIAEPI
jgi:2-polyprenyl-3-methyl-5-hydroxy-6-metoxy-1,4-benzoquinol methylase